MVRAGSRPEYFPVYFVEPYATNEAALGFDLATNPARREALTRARDTGDIVATARVVLVQEKIGQYGFLLFDPLYRKGASLNTPEQRRANLVGFVLGVFRIPDVVETAIRNHKRTGLDLSLYDESAEQKEGFLYRHPAEDRVGEKKAQARQRQVWSIPPNWKSGAAPGCLESHPDRDNMVRIRAEPGWYCWAASLSRWS